MKNLILSLSGALLLVSCGSTVQAVKGTVRFNQRESDTFTKKTLSQYIKKTETPTIVLRVPNTSKEEDITNQDMYSNSEVYGTIEKELTKAGFSVRDRSLFNKLSSDNKVQDYSKLKDLTGTELILEVVRTKGVSYHTNKYVNMNDKEKVAPFNINILGEKVEFKIISVKNNDIVGNYTFHYTPCTEGCKYIYNELGGIYNINTRESKKVGYETIQDKTALEKFYEISTKRLVEELYK